MDDGSIDPYQPNTACMAHDPRRCRTVVLMAAAAHKGKTALNSHQLKGGNVKNAVDWVCGECMYDVLCAMVVSP
jgi:hypothetical protein